MAGECPDRVGFHTAASRSHGNWTRHVTLKDITFRTRSLSDAGIFAQRGGKVALRGAIKLNEHLHDKADAETFAGIIAEDHGSVQFVERAGASLDIGNGSLSASYYGVIRLGCETARITSWGEQSNNLAINNGGRNDIELLGAFKTAVSAMSGSMFAGRFLGDIPGLSANTSASINIDQLRKNGRIIGPVSARHGAVISLPNRTVMSE